MIPSPDTLHPLKGFENLIYAKNSVSNPNIIVGDFTYIHRRQANHREVLPDWSGR